MIKLSSISGQIVWMSYNGLWAHFKKPDDIMFSIPIGGAVSIDSQLYYVLGSNTRGKGHWFSLKLKPFSSPLDDWFFSENPPRVVKPKGKKNRKKINDEDDLILDD